MLLDGNWLDMSSFGLAVVAAIIRPAHRCKVGHRFHFITHEVITDALSGASLMPFVLMMGAVFSSAILQEALQTNKLYMALGGLIGTAAVLIELFRQPAPPATVAAGVAGPQP